MTGSLVFITGGTGFIGSHVINATLRAGYRVLLSIRKPEQAQNVTRRYPEHASKIETVVISDMTKPESFKKVLSNVDFIFHLASPMPGTGTDVWTDYINPAVQTTEAILHAALEFPQIKKVVLDSSALALLPVDALFAKEVSAKDNTGEIIPVDLEAPFPEGLQGHGMKYAASKILAHQATRDFFKKNHPHYTLATFHPVFVLGESLIQESAEDIGGINAMFWQSLFSEKPIIAAGAWVHVRDVADAHVKALQAPIEPGTEFLLSGPPISWEDAVKFIRTKFPGLDCKLEPPFEGGWVVDVSTADRVLGLEWRSQETLIQDVISQQLAFQGRST